MLNFPTVSGNIQVMFQSPATSIYPKYGLEQTSQLTSNQPATIAGLLHSMAHMVKCPVLMERMDHSRWENNLGDFHRDSEDPVTPVENQLHGVQKKPWTIEIGDDPMKIFIHRGFSSEPSLITKGYVTFEFVNSITPHPNAVAYHVSQKHLQIEIKHGFRRTCT